MHIRLRLRLRIRIAHVIRDGIMSDDEDYEFQCVSLCQYPLAGLVTFWLASAGRQLRALR